MPKKYFATYTQQFDRDKGQDYGRFCIRSINTDTDEGFTELVLVATCSIATKQGQESIHETGGLLPPEYRVSDFARTNGVFEAWTLETLQQHRDTIGIEGACFQVLPVYINTDKGKKRGEFFLHEDKNVVGSLGCIVFNKDRFATLKQRMADLRKAGVKAMPLFITYS